MKKTVVIFVGLLGLVALGSGYWVGTGIRDQKPNFKSAELSPVTSKAVVVGVPELPVRATESAITSRVDIKNDEVRVLHHEIIRWDPRERR